MPSEDALLHYEVHDRHGRRVGRIEAIWPDAESGRPAFASVKTGWLPGRTHVVPLDESNVDHDARVVQVPYSEQAIRDVPAVATRDGLGLEEARTVWGHYLRAREGEGVDMPLQGERIRVDRRVEELGGVRLRKVVRKEIVMQPVEVLREHVIVERLRPDELDAAERHAADRDDEIVIRERGEVPVIGREVEPIGTVRARRAIETTEARLPIERRIEDVEVERSRLPRGGDVDEPL